MNTRSCPICGEAVELILEQIQIKKRFKADIIIEREIRICQRCKWYRYSAR